MLCGQSQHLCDCVCVCVCVFVEHMDQKALCYAANPSTYVLCMCVYMYVCNASNINTYARVYVYIHIRATQTYIHIHTHTHTHTYIHIHTYIPQSTARESSDSVRIFFSFNSTKNCLDSFKSTFVTLPKPPSTPSTVGSISDQYLTALPYHPCIC